MEFLLKLSQNVFQHVIQFFLETAVVRTTEQEHFSYIQGLLLLPVIDISSGELEVRMG